jgi:hypothetical protein
MRFFVSANPSNSGTSSLVDHGYFLEPDRFMEVTTVTLDAFAQEKKVDRFSLVKIDVERAEHHVLRGMTELLAARRIDHLVVEMVAHGEAQQILLDHGYHCYWVDDAKRTLVDIKNVPRDFFGDYLVVSPDHHEALTRRYAGRIV